MLSSLPADTPPSAADNLGLVVPGGSGVFSPSSDSPATQEKKAMFKSKGKTTLELRSDLVNSSIKLFFKQPVWKFEARDL